MEIIKTAKLRYGDITMEIVKTVNLRYGDTTKEQTLLFKEVSYEQAKTMIIKNHYSHKWNTAFGKINIGVFLNDNPSELLGVAVFGNLMNPNSYKSISDNIEKTEIVELNRLWVSDELGGNLESIMLSACWKFLRSKGIKLVQSFADGRLGVGTIYKATNFKYYGYEESLFFKHTETGIDYHKVPMENTMRPDGMIKLNTWHIEGKLKSFKVKTYRYIYTHWIKASTCC